MFRRRFYSSLFFFFFIFTAIRKRKRKSFSCSVGRYGARTGAPQLFDILLLERADAVFFFFTLITRARGWNVSCRNAANADHKALKCSELEFLIVKAFGMIGGKCLITQPAFVPTSGHAH